MKKNVVLIEHSSPLRKRLEAIINCEPDMQCSATFGSAKGALPHIQRLDPDTVILDVQLPGTSSIACLRMLKNTSPQIRVIMLTVFANAEKIFLALRAGADGCLTKSESLKELPTAIRSLDDGSAPLSGSIAQKIVQRFHEIGRTSRTERLSPREFEVLNFLAQGLTYKKIGCELDISPETVRTYLKTTRQKLRVATRSEAVALIAAI